MTLSSTNNGYIAFGLNTVSSMKFAEMVVVTVTGSWDVGADSTIIIYEYEGADGNRMPNVKMDSSWLLESARVGSQQNIEEAIISRKVVADCEVCKNVKDELYVLWATGDKYAKDANSVGYHSGRGHSHKLSMYTSIEPSYNATVVSTNTTTVGVLNTSTTTGSNNVQTTSTEHSVLQTNSEPTDQISTDHAHHDDHDHAITPTQSTETISSDEKIHLTTNGSVNSTTALETLPTQNSTTMTTPSNTSTNAPIHESADKNNFEKKSASTVLLLLAVFCQFQLLL